VSEPDPRVEAALGKFDQARDTFAGTMTAIPEEALTYLRPGDDYALGGLVAHANFVLQHYLITMDALINEGFGELRPQEPPELHETANRRAKAGLRPGERAVELEEMGRLHEQFSQRARRLAANWDRKAQVYFGAAEEPYPTAPSDVLGWVIDHYHEHVPHAAELLAEWRASAQGGTAS
jgi:hypothetical protein